MESQNLHIRRELFIATITAASVIISIDLFVIPMSDTQIGLIYIFDLGVTMILIWDFVDRLKKSDNQRKFLLRHLYEIPALLPLIFFGIIEYDAYLWLCLEL